MTVTPKVTAQPSKLVDSSLLPRSLEATREVSSGDVAVGLGAHIRNLRSEHRMTLNQLSEASGVSRSGLSKIENDKASPTYDVIQKLAAGFGMSVVSFLSQTYSSTNTAARRAVFRAGTGTLLQGRGYTYRRCCEELTSTKMLPFRATIHARKLEEAGGYVRHSGEECLFVISGAVEFHTEHYQPVTLNAGDIIYVDSQMGHACVSTSPELAEVLWITVDV